MTIVNLLVSRTIKEKPVGLSVRGFPDWVNYSETQMWLIPDCIEVNDQRHSRLSVY